MQNKTSRNIIGPDLNEYRGDVNYTLLATQTPYAYLRGSGYGTGRFRIDRKFIEYVNGLRNVGVKTGAYHYAVPSTDLTTADVQCDGFIDILQQAYGPGRYGDLFPVIDIEAPLDKSISTDALLDWVDRFRKRFERKTRRKMMIYTGAFFIDLYNNFYHTKKGFILADMPLWIAMYPELPSNPPYPRDQGGWTRWRMWQFTETGTMPGVNPPVDLNYGPENLDLLTQPRNVRDFRAVATGQEIRMNWTKNTDIDLGGYNIFINSNYVTTLGRDANSYVLKLANKPSLGEKYIMSIEAFDTDGDFSQQRASANVTFGREIVLNNENSQECQCNNRWDVDDYTDVKSVEFKDPVDGLAKRFIKPIERKEDFDIYDDFVETDDEFDDILYMKRLEAERAYKKYYDNRDSRDKFGLSEINRECRRENPYKKLDKKCENPCQRCNKNYEEHHEEYDKWNEEQYDDIEKQVHDDNDIIDRNNFKEHIDYEEIDTKGIEQEENHILLEDVENSKRYEKPVYDDILREEYEGDRRRLENRDPISYKVCEECVQPKSNCMKCEYLLQNMYLNNCDYGHKHHKKKCYDYKEYDECYPSKKKSKKKKKHHKKHHR
ncbi:MULTISPECIES: glycoside hydrolase family 25 protein [unclassified Clostridium]|uniref:glycoside hydrolase family 25 protein n=1 Tax=unclassified Clostridium TaxID=2614128 RepID=UPI003217A26B